MNYPAIKGTNLSKRYRIGLYDDNRRTLATTITNLLRSPVQNLRRLRQLTNFDEMEEGRDIIWALRDASFSVLPGEVVGLIGPNGAGKSTLLKIISRITYPTSGRLELRGKVSSLLEVGTGFHPELTGRENIYLNGTILGMRRTEIDRKFDEIVDFSGVEQFIDTPIKRYSTGMRVRLAFSVAAHLEPEILLVDEVLSVGDAEFQKKSLGKMESVAQEGRTVLFVSHHMDAVRTLCTRAILLTNGRISADGKPDKIIDQYLEIAKEHSQGFDWKGEAIFYNESRGMAILRVCAHNGNGNPKGEFSEDEAIHVETTYRLDKRFKGFAIKIRLRNDIGSLVLLSLDRLKDGGENRGPGTFTTTCIIPAGLLNQSEYMVGVWGRVANGEILTRANLIYIDFSVKKSSNSALINEHLSGSINPNVPQWTMTAKE